MRTSFETSVLWNILVLWVYCPKGSIWGRLLLLGVVWLALLSYCLHTAHLFINDARIPLELYVFFNQYQILGDIGTKEIIYKWHIDFFCCCCLVAKLCLTLCNPVDYCPRGSSVHGISQARILEWVAIFFSRRSFQPRDRTHVSCVAGRFFTTEPPGKSK